MNVLVVNDEERKRSYIHRALEKFEAIQANFENIHLISILVIL